MSAAGLGCAFMKISLKDKVCLVTGGSRGIGKGIVQALVNAEAIVAFDYRSNKEMAESLLDEIKQAGGQARVYQADISKADQVESLVEAVHKDFGPISVLVNNAGINRDRTFSKMTGEEWDEVMAVNLRGTFNVTKAVLPDMVEANWGRVINISSFVGQRGNFGQANYAASKAGIIGMTKSLALETAKKGITVNALAPGFIETDMTAGIPEEVLKKLEAGIPIQRMGRVEEVASAVVFLASPQASYITGQALGVNGGLYT